MSTKQISDLLLEHEIKPSYPRIHIYKYLHDYKNHPTADEIYNHVIDQIPTLSKTTVYNTLNLLEDKNIVNSINLEDNEKHYELVIDEHSHFKCEVCGKIYDIPYKDLNILPDEYSNYKVKELEIFLKGICANCNKR